MNRFKYLSVFLTVMIFLSAPCPAQAKTREVTGDKAEKILEVLRSGPYVRDGSGSRIVYVVAAPDYKNSMGLYAATYDLKSEYEFRWYIIDNSFNKDTENMFFGIYESRSPQDLARIYNLLLKPGERHVPVKNEKTMDVMAQLVRAIQNVLMSESGETRCLLPMLAIPTENGIIVMDEVEEMGRGSTLATLIDKAVKEKGWPVDYDLEAVIADMSEKSKLTGYYCGKEGDSQGRLFPHNEAPVLFTIPENRCYEAQVMLDSGWIGLKYFLHSDRYGYAYVRADQLKPR